MIQRIVRQLREHFDEIIVTTGEATRYQDLLNGVTILEDEIKNCGPMGGLYTGLKAASNEYSFVTACDMPFLSSAFVQFLVSQIDGSTDAIVPEVGGIKCVTRAIYGKRCLNVIDKLAERKRFSLQGLSNSVEVGLITEQELQKIDSNLRSLHGFNTRMEWGNLS